MRTLAIVVVWLLFVPHGAQAFLPKGQRGVRGEPAKTTSPAARTVLRVFDEAGNLGFLTNRNGKVWRFLPDPANRLTSTISPLQYSNTVAFNDRGLPFLLRQP